MDMTPKKPFVSVIVPVYNVEPYLRCCVDSVLAQTFSDFELILVDDGSTDGSGAICEEYAERDKRVHVVHKQNGGLGSARNAGVKHAHGKYIEFLDSDDWITPDTLAFLLHEAESKKLDLVLFGARSFVDGDAGEINTAICSYDRSHNFDVVMDGVTCYRKMTEHGEYYTSICMRFFSSSFYRGHGFSFQESIIHEDEDIGFLSVILAKRVEIVDKAFYQRRYRPGSIMTEKTELTSLHGYAGVFAGLAEAYRTIRPSGEMKALYLDKMQEFMSVVTTAYLFADRKKKKEIRSQTQAFLRKGLQYRIPLSAPKKLAEQSLFLHDVCASIFNKIKRF